MAASEDEPNGNRATVGMVLRTVDDLKELTTAQLGRIHDKLDALAGIPDRLGILEDRQADINARVGRLEDSDASQLTAVQQKRAYRSGTLPMILIGVLGAFFTGAGVILTYVALTHPH